MENSIPKKAVELLDNYEYKFYEPPNKYDAKKYKEKLRRSALNCWDGKVPPEVEEERKRIIKEMLEKGVKKDDL